MNCLLPIKPLVSFEDCSSMNRREVDLDLDLDQDPDPDLEIAMQGPRQRKSRDTRQTKSRESANIVETITRKPEGSGNV